MPALLTIAEIGQAHDGSLGLLHSYIDALSKTGVDIVKFQTHIAEAESSIHEPFRVNFSFEDKTRFEYWKRMELSKNDWQQIKNHCEKVGLEFMSSPFSNAAVDLLESIGVKRYKIGSGEVSNSLMLEKVASTGKEIILSSGMSSFQELDNAVDLIRQNKNSLSVLQCTTSYPTPYSKLGLNLLVELKARYPFAKIGLSDHTGEIYAGIAAVALGAEILEFHTVFDKRMFGPDSDSSLEIDEIGKLVEGAKAIKQAVDNPIDKNDLKDYIELKSMFEKSLAINKSVQKGHIISFSDLEAKKPLNFGIKALEFKSVIGRRLNKNLSKWDFLKEEDLE